MKSSLFADAVWLDVAHNANYGAMTIPCETDCKIDKLLYAWMAMSSASRNDELNDVSENGRFTLLCYSERKASLAVRIASVECIFLGLLALGLDGWSGDWRDNAVLLGLHYDAAVRIRSQPQQVFERAATLLPAKPALEMRLFTKRTEKDKSLAAMGYIADHDKHGFIYKRTW